MINEIVLMGISITKFCNIYGYMWFSFIPMAKKEESKATGCQAKVAKETGEKFS